MVRFGVAPTADDIFSGTAADSTEIEMANIDGNDEEEESTEDAASDSSSPSDEFDHNKNQHGNAWKWSWLKNVLTRLS